MLYFHSMTLKNPYTVRLETFTSSWRYAYSKYIGQGIKSDWKWALFSEKNVGIARDHKVICLTDILESSL